jgi:hypothetical protein
MTLAMSASLIEISKYFQTNVFYGTLMMPSAFDAIKSSSFVSSPGRREKEHTARFIVVFQLMLRGML